MKNKVGEAPVIFDSTLVYPSKLLLENYYQNKGYFFTEVNTSIKTKRRRTTVTYNIKPNKAFKFRNVIFPYNTEVEQIAHDKMGGTLLKRERITILQTIKTSDNALQIMSMMLDITTLLKIMSSLKLILFTIHMM
ncbi:MAG: hypothetical protein IPK03_10605 [Bacteroidetes bacterium]|nr:hypothetical protein [Bacteroidota bacterium]